MEDLLNLYERYCHLNDNITNGSNYYRLLVKHTSLEEVTERLFPDYISTDTDELRRRRDLEYLYLWDVLFYGVYEYTDNYLWKDDNHRNKCISNISELVLNNQDDYIRDVIFRIAYHWPKLRILIYSEDEKALKQCNTENDYKCFIDNHPNTYKEYLFFAKYEYCKKTGETFTELNELLSLFPHSELINIEELKRLCQQIGNINVMFGEEVKYNEILEDFLKNFIEKFRLSGTIDERNYYVSGLISIEDYLYILYPDKFTYLKSIVDGGRFYLGTCRELEDFIKRLSDLTSVKFEIPRANQIDFIMDRLDIAAIKKSAYEFKNIGFWCRDKDSNILIQLIDGRALLNASEDKHALFLLNVVQ